MTLMSFTDRTTKDWTKAQMQLPPMNDAVIKFTVVTETPAIHSYYKPHLALDDIQISNGLCPDYGRFTLLTIGCLRSFRTNDKFDNVGNSKRK